MKQSEQKKLLIYTVADPKYYEFAILYPLFAIISNPEAIVEIGIVDFPLFKWKYGHLLNFYEATYKDRIYFTPVTRENVMANSLRFIVPPKQKAEYIYIGDVDILLTDDILTPHLNNIERNKLDFSNIKRPSQPNKLSGLHFIAYEKMYPINTPAGIDLKTYNDEELLYVMMEGKGYKIPTASELSFRPILGIHISYFSRPPLATLTTADKKVDFPDWEASIPALEKYRAFRFSPPAKEFMNAIRTHDIELRRIVQIIDMYVYYRLNAHPAP